MEPAMTEWRGRLEFLGLLLACAVSTVAIGFHAYALANKDDSYTLTLRGFGFFAGLAVAIGSLLCLLLVLLPRLVFGWPTKTPTGRALAATVVVGIGSALAGAMGAVSLAGGLSELGTDISDRESNSNINQLWAEILIGLGTLTASVVVALFTVYAWRTIASSRERGEVLRPTVGPPPLGSSGS